MYAGILAQQEDGTAPADPMSEDAIAARRGTFENGTGWPHEGKRGWKCKVQRMVEAGWCFDPAPVTSGEEEEADGVTCFYCGLSLDGWEPKDDPLQEHRKRTPDCAFLALGGGVTKKGKGGAKKSGRASTASQGSRLSTQSAMSEVPSMADSLAEDTTAGMDDSITSTATTASQATVTGGKKGAKKGGKTKAAAKGTKGRKRAGTVDSQQADDEGLYPNIGSQALQASQQDDSFESVQVADQPKKKGRGRPSKQPVDSSVVEISSLEAAPTKKAARGRKAKAQPEPEPESQADDVSAQIQQELDHSMDLASQDLDQSTPQAAAPKPKRGMKRTSDGLKKKPQDESEISAMAVEFPAPPKPAPAAKTKRGRKPSKQAQAEESEVEISQQPQPTQDDVSMSEPEPPAKAPKGKKGAAKGGKATRTRKASSTRSSSRTRGSKASRAASPSVDPVDDRPEDLDRDEREIEEQLARMATEQISQGMADIQHEQEKAAEYEASPSHHHQEKHVQAIQHLEEELAAETASLTQPGENLTAFVKQVAKPSMSSMPGAFSPTPPSDASPEAEGKENAQPSPSGSDKENVPSSALAPQLSASKPQPPPPPVLSPSKTTRIPLAPSTPNKAPLSPSKRGSPTKQLLGPLTSTIPWIPADLDALLMASPQPSPGTLGMRLAQTAGKLTSPEKGLTVEEWVRRNAGAAEEALRRRCEALVSGFEGEGARGMEVLEGLGVVG